MAGYNHNKDLLAEEEQWIHSIKFYSKVPTIRNTCMICTMHACVCDKLLLPSCGLDKDQSICPVALKLYTPVHHSEAWSLLE